MGGHAFPEILCAICTNPVDLTVDLSTDENGRAVHENCYVRHISTFSNNSPTPMTAD